MSNDYWVYIYTYAQTKISMEWVWSSLFLLFSSSSTTHKIKLSLLAWELSLPIFSLDFLIRGGGDAGCGDDQFFCATRTVYSLSSYTVNWFCNTCAGKKNGYRSDSSNLINQKVGFIIYPYTASFLVPARCSHCITNPVLMWSLTLILAIFTTYADCTLIIFFRPELPEDYQSIIETLQINFWQLPWSVQDLSPNIIYVIHSNMMLNEFVSLSSDV